MATDTLIFAPYEMKLPRARDGLCYGAAPIDALLRSTCWAEVKSQLPQEARNSVYWSFCRLVRAVEETPASGSATVYVIHHEDAPYKYMSLPDNINVKRIDSPQSLFTEAPIPS